MPDATRRSQKPASSSGSAAPRSPAAIARADRALRLSPMDALAYRANNARCIANIRLGEYEKYLEVAKRITEAAPRTQSGLRNQISAFAYLGRLEEARVAADRLLAIRTGLHHLEIREPGSIFPRTPDQSYRRRPAEGGAAGVNVDRKRDANFGVDLASRSLI